MSILRQYRNNIHKLKLILKGSSLPFSEREELYNILTDESISSEIKFLVYQQIRKNNHLFDAQLLSDKIGIHPQALYKIFREEPVKVKFPVALDNKAELVTAYITKLTTTVPKNCFYESSEIKESLDVIKNLLKNREFKTKDFFVVFDKDFTGRSFMLAVVAGLILPQENLKGYAFTGIVNESGEIFSVEYIPQKKVTAESENLKLITPHHIDNLDQLVYYLGKEKIDIPFIALVNRSEEEVKSALQKIENSIKKKEPSFSIQKLVSIFNLDVDRLFMFYRGLLPPLTFEELSGENPWIQQIENYEKLLREIYSIFPSRSRVLHMGFAVPSTLAFSMGIKLGTKKPVVIYHYQSDKYVPVMDLSTPEQIRSIKKIKKDIIENSETISVHIPEKTHVRELAVALWIASHMPYPDIEDYLKDKNIPLVKIELKDFQGNLPLPDEIGRRDYWIKIVSEIYSALNVIKSKYGVSKYHFFMSVPVPIGFALGMAIGHFWEGVVYNLMFGGGEKRYYPVFNINDRRLSSIF